MNIIAIGGGRIYAGETKSIDSYAFSLLPEENKLLTIVPIASKDRKDYIVAIKTAYENLGASTIIVGENDLETDIFTQALSQSAGMYIGGGDVEYLLEKIHNIDATDKIIDFANGGKLIIGLSAGCGIFFEKVIFVKNGKTFVINGLGIIDGVAIPHYEPGILENSKNEIVTELNQERAVYGLSDGSALHFTGKSEYTVVEEPYSRGVWQISSKSGIVGARQITVH